LVAQFIKRHSILADLIDRETSDAPVCHQIAEEIERYNEDGVNMLRQVLAPNWVAMIEEGLEKAIKDQSLLGKFMSRKVEGYKMDIFFVEAPGCLARLDL
jgi:hypothetical protein